MYEIRHARESDWPFWQTLDGHVGRELYFRKVAAGECYVVETDGTAAGLMRWNLFWDCVPFCTLLYINAPRRGQGLGKALMERWEADMRALGHDMVITSTQSDETAQHFYRKLGYRDAGGFVVDVPGHEQPLELIMVKGIGTSY